MGRHCKNLVGEKFGRLTVIERNGSDKYSKPIWKCECECGTVKSISSTALNNGTRSCGCLLSEISKRVNTKHGERHTRLYRIYYSIKSRCYNENHMHYSLYGGKGVTLCDEWHDYINFSKWSKLNGYNEDLTIDRICSDGNYSPENCRWVTWKQQENNRSNNTRIEYNGRSLTIAEWSEETGINASTISNRLKKGMSSECIFYKGNLQIDKNSPLKFKG